MSIEWNQDMITGMLAKYAKEMNYALNGDDDDGQPHYLFALVVMENLVHHAGTAIVSNIDRIDQLAGMLAEQALALHNKEADHQIVELNARH